MFYDGTRLRLTVDKRGMHRVKSELRYKMKLKITRIILTVAALIVFAGASTFAAQTTNANRKSTVKGEMKQSGKEAGEAGKSLGGNVKHGRVVRGGKHFGKHMYRSGKHFGKGTGAAAKKTGKVVKNAAKP